MCDATLIEHAPSFTYIKTIPSSLQHNIQDPFYNTHHVGYTHCVPMNCSGNFVFIQDILIYNIFLFPGPLHLTCNSYLKQNFTGSNNSITFDE